jgi:hypothetical protein
MTAMLAMGARAQISPGPLSRPHASLEGIEHCTACHTLGKALSNGNCLRCHTEIDTRMREKRGFHANLGSRQCMECHKEHHGRDFPMERFDPKSFTHDAVGFTLAGRHSRLACRNCHKKDFIRANDIQRFSDSRKSETYLGLSRDCAGCHDDPHHRQLGSACTRCHSQEHWKPVDAFSHDATKYPLTGLHRSVDCAKCHPPEGGTAANRRFVGITFSSCTSCHRDPHAARFGPACERCHSTEGWLQGATRHFNHDATPYPLRGKHREVSCRRCHGNQAAAGTFRVGDRAPYRIARFSRCRDCHADPHNGQFAKQKGRGACESCHTVEGFRPSLFTEARHEDTAFPLRGAHRAVPCFRCHPEGPKGGEAKVLFVRTKFRRCVDCHDDAHRGEFKDRMPRGCATCHTEESWKPAVFSHDRARFPLDGKHRNVPCDKCHTASRSGTPAMVTFNHIPLTCEGCHEPRRGIPSRAGN